MDLSSLRLKQIFDSLTNPNQSPDPTFGQSGGTMPIPSNGPVQPGGMNDIASKIAQLYQPDTSASDAYNKVANNYPTAPNPGVGLKLLGAGLGTLSDMYGNHQGSKVYDNLTGETDYQGKLQDWKNQLQPLQQSANLEKGNNANSRMLATQIAGDQIKSDAQNETARNNQVKSDETAKKNQNIEDYRNQLIQLKQTVANNPDLVPLKTEGGNAMLYNKKTGETVDTGIDQGSMTAMDKLNSGLSNAMTLEQLRNTDKLGQIGAQGDQSRQTKETVPGINPKAPTSHPQSESQNAQGLFNKAKKLVDTDPELGPFIKLGANTGEGGTRSFEITPFSPGGFLNKATDGFLGGASGPNPDQMKRILNSIYGDSTPTPTSPNSPVANKTASTPPTAENIVPPQVLAAGPGTHTFANGQVWTVGPDGKTAQRIK